jgi:biopolymer transport protein ExbB/TolQ
MFTTVANFFQAGGPMMWVILAVMAAALAVIVERLNFYLRLAADNADELAARVAHHVTENNVSAALDELGEEGGPARRLMRRSVETVWEGGGADEIRQAVEELAMREMPRYGRRLNYLAMLANVATLAGLLGTIFGLQQSFSSLALAEAADKSSVLAAGISQAMNTTAFGLMVAMPCLAIHSRLTSLAAHRTEDSDAAVVKLLNFFDARDRQYRGERRMAV